MYLNLIFKHRPQYENAKKFFETESDFYAEADDQNLMFSFEVQDQADADMTEHGLEQEIMEFQPSLIGYHFELDDEDFNPMESKSTNVKSLIERIVERVIAKKLTEATQLYTKGDKIKVDMGSGPEEVVIMNNIKAGISGIDFISLKRKTGAPYTLTYNKFKKVIVESKRRLRESTDPDGNEYFHINDLEDHIYNNIDEIKSNMKDYGWKLKDISKIGNYYDLATLLDIDSRLLKTVDLEEYTLVAQDYIKSAW
jgi:hypothetical protein